MRGVDRLDRRAGEGRPGRVDDERDTGRRDRSGGDQSTRLARLSESAVDYDRVDQDDGGLPWPDLSERSVEILGDDAALELVDHPVAESDRQDARRRRPVRRRGRCRWRRACRGHLVGIDTYVDAR